MGWNYVQWDWIILEWHFDRLKTNGNIEGEAVRISVTQRNSLINFMHGFCDSSSQVYCGMAYIRVEPTFGIRVGFLCVKPK